MEGNSEFSEGVYNLRVRRFDDKFWRFCDDGKVMVDEKRTKKLTAVRRVCRPMEHINLNHIYFLANTFCSCN